MRGTPDGTPCNQIRRGIIPAYAGNTSPYLAMVQSVKDHPRVCGEHGDETQESIEDLGSSPRMRGTRVGVGGWNAVNGIIPAYAGNT